MASPAVVVEAPGEPTAAMAKAAERFESLLLSQVLSAAMPEESSLMGSGPGTHIYKGWLETYLADHLAAAGGLGLQDAILRQFGGSS
ncbi:MAG: rod-binding protein [Planctomycetes bacterium]|nr:rod-binding protein [Planctomycetota bacterium]